MKKKEEHQYLPNLVSELKKAYGQLTVTEPGNLIPKTQNCFIVGIVLKIYCSTTKQNDGEKK